MKIVSGFAGIGKTTAAKNNHRILDLESSKFKWLPLTKAGDISDEETKGVSERKLNPEWPQNYLSKIVNSMNRRDVDIILISPSYEVLEELEKANLDYILVFPSLDSKQEILKRLEARNNNPEFIRKIDEKYEEIYYWLKSKNKQKIILGKGQYLTDILSIVTTDESEG